MTVDRAPCVATVPAEHPYLDAVLPPSVRRLPQPRTDDPWAPSPVLDRATVRTATAGADLVHLHFGFDHLDPEEVATWVAELRCAALPLVLTVHDLRNPHHGTRSRHDAHLDLLVPAAARVLTLTPGAAAEIRSRWGVQAVVVPHPTAAPPTRSAPAPTTPGLVGLHLKSLRRNVVEPERVVRAVLAGTASAGGWLQVDVHPDVLEHPDLRAVRTLASAGALTLRVHPRASDTVLRRYLQELHVSVLGHRFGTHSGWLEDCRDVGTAVVAPTCGFYDQQWESVHTYTHDESAGLDEDSLSAAVRAAVLAPCPAPADPLWRAEQREAVRRTHEAVYRAVVAA